MPNRTIDIALKVLKASKRATDEAGLTSRAVIIKNIRLLAGDEARTVARYTGFIFETLGCVSESDDPTLVRVDWQRVEELGF